MDSCAYCGEELYKIAVPLSGLYGLAITIATLSGGITKSFSARCYRCSDSVVCLHVRSRGLDGL